MIPVTFQSVRSGQGYRRIIYLHQGPPLPLLPGGGQGLGKTLAFAEVSSRTIVGALYITVDAIPSFFNASLRSIYSLYD